MSADFHMGRGKMGGIEQVKLRNFATGGVLERRLRPDLRMEVVDVENRRLEYLYQDGELYVKPSLLHLQSTTKRPAHTKESPLRRVWRSWYSKI